MKIGRGKIWFYATLIFVLIYCFFSLRLAFINDDTNRIIASLIYVSISLFTIQKSFSFGESLKER
jgi:hypothetical protein